MANSKLLRGRSSEIGACFTITMVVRHRRTVFADPRLASCVIDEIRRSTTDGTTESLAWVAMPDHVHWLFALTRGRLSDVVGAMKSRSARAINALTGTQGRFWQDGFYDHRLRSNEDLQAQARYLVANPLRAGLAFRLRGYPFWWCKWIEHERDW